LVIKEAKKSVEKLVVGWRAGEGLPARNKLDNPSPIVRRPRQSCPCHARDWPSWLMYVDALGYIRRNLNISPNSSCRNQPYYCKEISRKLRTAACTASA